MKKRLISLALVLVLCLALLPAALADEKPPLCDVYQCDGFYITAKPYKLNSTKYKLLGTNATTYHFYDGHILVETANVDENYVNRRFVQELNLADKDGNIVLPEGSMYYKAGDFTSYLKTGRYGPSEGLMAFWDGKSTGDNSDNLLMGFMDYQGNVVIPCQFDFRRTNAFHDGFAVVETKDERGDYTGLIDKTGREPFKARVVGPDGWNIDVYTFLGSSNSFGHGLISAYRIDYGAETVTHGYVDGRGNMVLPLVTMDESVYDSIHSDYWTAYAEGKIDGYLMPTQNAWSRFSDDGYAVVFDLRSGDQLAYAYAIIDTSGNVVGTFRDMEPYGDATYGGFHDGLLHVRFIDNRGNTDGSGYIDTTGNVVWREDTFNMGAGHDYSCGVMVTSASQAVDKDGNVLIPKGIFEDMRSFHDNLSLAYVGAQPYVLEIHQGTYSGSGTVYDPRNSASTPTQPTAPAKYTASAPSTGTTTVQDDGETKTVLLYPAGTVITLSDGYEFSSIENLSSGHLLSTAGLKSFSLPNDGAVYQMFIVTGSGASEYVYAKVEGGAAPSQPETPKNLAYASTQTVTVDGKAVEFQMYALKDAQGNPTNYVKLRDIASVVNGTKAQFEVGWDGAVNIETGKAYTANGTEMKTPYSGDRAYSPATAATNVNGSAASLEAIVLTDDAGGAYTYYKLRDLGKALGFNVDWSAEKGVFVETDKPYSGT